MNKKVIISRCILGEYCRYDGKTKKISEVVEAFEGWQIIPFCPEAPVFGTPRQRIDVVQVADEQRILKHNTKEDVTSLLEEEIEKFLANNPEADCIVLKSKSPSCGLNTTPVLDPNNQELYKGSGIGAKMLRKHFLNTPMYDEHTLFNSQNGKEVSQQDHTK